MLIKSRLIQIVVITFILNLIHAQQQTDKEIKDRKAAELQGQLVKEEINNLQNNLKNVNMQIYQDLNAKATALLNLQNQANLRVQRLKQIDMQLKSWNEFLKKINEVVAKGNNLLITFNDKVTAIMTKMVGFQEQLRVILSLDTLIVCILSLVLVKILKDEFIDEGYQLVGSSGATPSAHALGNSVLNDREMTE